MAVDCDAVAAQMRLGHDLTMEEEHAQYMKVANELYEKMSLDELQAAEKKSSGNMADSFKVSTMFHIALKNAISKKLMKTLPPMHATVVFALYKENNRILPKGDDVTGVTHPNGEDFIRKKHQQMAWLFEERKEDCSWSMLGVDDGCPMDSAGMMKNIYTTAGFDNVSVHKLKDAVIAGTNEDINHEKCKSEAWDEGDALVKASQKAGAILYAFSLACEEKHGDKKHIIVYTDSDLSTDLGLCGLNFDTVINGKVDCSVSHRFGYPNAVNCGKLLEEGGIAPGMPRESMVHLSLRHKLRMNLLPPLAPIIDTNCGHKAITPEAVKPTLKKVRDYKGSFDMDWLMAVGICGKAAGRTPIASTSIAWVNSVGESNFWAAPSGDEDEAAKKLKSCGSWHKIFAALCEMHEWHKEELEKNGMLTPECVQYVDWVKAMDVEEYMRLSDGILAKLEGKEVTMPEPLIMDMSYDDLKKLAAAP